MSIDDKMNYTVDQSYDVSNDRSFLQSADKVNPAVQQMKTNKFAMALDLATPVLGAGFGAMPQFSGKNMVATFISAALGQAPTFGGQQMGAAGGMFGSQASQAPGGGAGGRLFMTGPGGAGGAGALPPPPPPPPPGLGGGFGGFGAPPPPPGMGGGGIAGLGGPDQFQGQIDNMFNNNMMFLMIQTKVQNMGQQMQTISNIMKADSDSRLNAVRNFRS